MTFSTVPERPHVGGENHERPGLQQRQRGGLQRVRGAGGRPHRRLQRLLPGAEEESQVAPPVSCLLLADPRNLQLTVAVLVLVPAVG